jgi:hypothetical protein
MAGGKGKSSGGKSSGGKVGVDGSKKQQSHSSKAGLQVSIAQTSFRRSRNWLAIVCKILKLWIDPEAHQIRPHQVASHTINNNDRAHGIESSSKCDAPSSESSIIVFKCTIRLFSVEVSSTRLECQQI